MSAYDLGYRSVNDLEDAMNKELKSFDIHIHRFNDGYTARVTIDKKDDGVPDEIMIERVGKFVRFWNSGLGWVKDIEEASVFLKQDIPGQSYLFYSNYGRWPVWNTKSEMKKDSELLNIYEMLAFINKKDATPQRRFARKADACNSLYLDGLLRSEVVWDVLKQIMIKLIEELSY